MGILKSGHGTISKKPDPSDGFWSSTGVSKLYLVSILHIGEVSSGRTDTTIFILCVDEVISDFWIGRIQSDKYVGSNLLPSIYESLIHPIGTEGDVEEFIPTVRTSNISRNDTSCGCIYELNFPSLKTALRAFLIALHSSDVAKTACYHQRLTGFTTTARVGFVVRIPAVDYDPEVVPG